MEKHSIQRGVEILYAKETEISSSLMGHLAPCQVYLNSYLKHQINVFLELLLDVKLEPQDGKNKQIKKQKPKLELKGAMSSFMYFEKMAKLFKNVISNPFQSPPTSAIDVSFCFRITPLVFFFLSKPLVVGFPALSPSKK